LLLFLFELDDERIIIKHKTSLIGEIHS